MKAIAVAVSLLAGYAAGRLVDGALYGVAQAGRRALQGALVAAGVAGLTASLVAPDLPRLLTALDRPLALVPMGASFIHGAVAYFDFPRAAPWYPALAGVGLLVVAQLVLRERPSR